MVPIPHALHGQMYIVNMTKRLKSTPLFETIISKDLNQNAIPTMFKILRAPTPISFTIDKGTFLIYIFTINSETSPS